MHSPAITGTGSDTARPIKDRRDGAGLPAALILIACVTFNAWLAVVNAHAAALNAAAVAACQAALFGAAIVVAAVSRPRGGAKWVALLWLAALGFLLLTMFRGRLELRYFSDIASIFAFILLGLSIGDRALARTLLLLQALLVGFALWELLDPAGYGALFRVQNYYVNTRGFSGDDFWAAQELFLSSERPTGRLLLPGSGFHRGSSLFLEPVSLGNWTIVVTLALGALRPVLGQRAFWLLVAGNAVLLFACDGRLAILINLILIANWWLAPRVPAWLPVLYLPLAFLLLLASLKLGLLETHGDTLAGRLRYGLEYLLALDVPTMLGLYAGSIVVGADSGWSYFIATQSLVALIAVWLALTIPPARTSPATRRTISGMALFVSLSLPVSYSIFSIKTAAMLWALYGCTLRRDRDGAPDDALTRGPQS